MPPPMTKKLPRDVTSTDDSWRFPLPTVALFIVLLAAAPRAILLAQDRCLWLDEAMLSLNVRDCSWRMLRGPLKYDQAAPIGFLFYRRPP